MAPRACPARAALRHHGAARCPCSVASASLLLRFRLVQTTAPEKGPDSVLPWTIAPACRIADGRGGAQLFQQAVELAFDSVQAAQDQRESVMGGHERPGTAGGSGPDHHFWPGPQLAERIKLGLRTLRRW